MIETRNVLKICKPIDAWLLKLNVRPEPKFGPEQCFEFDMSDLKHFSIKIKEIIKALLLIGKHSSR